MKMFSHTFEGGVYLNRFTIITIVTVLYPTEKATYFLKYIFNRVKILFLIRIRLLNFGDFLSNGF